MRSKKPENRKVIGIDLAGSPKGDTGICTLEGDSITSCTVVRTDEQIIHYVAKANPALIAIDAPLNLPPGRKSIEDRTGEHFRGCDRELLRRRIPFFPITLGPMRSLTERGIRMKRALTRCGYTVIETYPGAAQDIWNIARKQEGLLKLLRGLQRLGVKGLHRKMSGDELDAVTAALVGRCFLDGEAEVLGSFTRGAIVIPRAKGLPKAYTTPINPPRVRGHCGRVTGVHLSRLASEKPRVPHHGHPNRISAIATCKRAANADRQVCQRSEMIEKLSN